MNELVIDVSKWDGDVCFADWRDWRGCWGVIVKGGGSDVGRYVDSWFARNYDKARAAGLHVGCYYYSAATTEQEARDDAMHFISACLKGRAWDLPVYMDVEERAQLNIGADKLTRVVLAFCDTLEQYGYKAGVYASGSAFVNNMHGDAQLGELADWIAAWGATRPRYIAVDFGLWQQGSMSLLTGDIAYADVSGHTDCNWCSIDYPSVIVAARLNNCSPEAGANAAPTTTPTGSIEDVMRVAYGELGYYAPDDPERGSKYGRWMAEVTGEDWMAGPSVEIWWCCMFVSWVLAHAGVRCAGFPSQNTDLALSGGAAAHCVDKSQIQRGDILIFDWDWSTSATDHIGFATGSPSGGYVDTIEGNVGNAVKEKTRALSTIRYVVRPDYEGAGDVSLDNVTHPDYDAALDVDGYAGHLTVHKLQEQLGTFADGVLDGQLADAYQYRRAVVAVRHDGGSGSPCVKALQSLIGAGADGLWGKETSTKLQEYLTSRGYDCGGADGYFGELSARALQRCLNDGKLV